MSTELNIADAPNSAAPDNDSGVAPQDVIDQRRSEGLPNAFDDDDDDEAPAAEAVEKPEGTETEAGADEPVNPPGAKPATAPVAEAADTDEVPAELLSQAEQYGFDAAGLSADALGRSIAAIDRLFFNEGARVLGVPTAPAPVADPPPAAAPKAATPGEFKLGAKIDAMIAADAEFDNPLTQAIKAELADLHGHYETRVAAIESKHKAAEERAEIEDAFQYEKEVDGYLDKLPSGWEAVFGKGTGKELVKAGATAKPSLEQRIKLVDACDVLIAGYKSRNQPVPDRPTMLAKALPIAFPEKFKELTKEEAKTEIRKGIKTRRENFTPPPTAAGGRAPKSSASEQRLEATMKKLGMSLEGEEGEASI